MRRLQPLAAARARPDTITYASPGVGSDDHLQLVLLQAATGTRFVHVVYQGDPQLRTAVLGKQVDCMGLNLGPVTANQEKLRVLSQGGATRSRFRPDVPTLIELGHPVQMASERGLVMAAGPLLASSGNISPAAGWVAVAGVLFFVVNFAYSSGPLAWVVISEVFPLGARGKGAGVATACNWLANYVVAMVYPIAVGSKEGRDQQRRVGISFLAFAAVCVASIAYIAAFVPETHQLSLEQIEAQFERRRLRHTAPPKAEADAPGSQQGDQGGCPTPLEAPGKRPMP
jgi:hypothetical protein